MPGLPVIRRRKGNQAERIPLEIETKNKFKTRPKGGNYEKESKIIKRIIGISDDRIHAGRLRRRR